MKKEQFDFQPADPSAYKTYTHPHEYDMALTFHFCSNCGVMLWKTADAEQFKDAICVNAGTLDDPKLIDDSRPTKEFWVRDRTKWVENLEGAEQESMYGKR